MKRIRNTGSSRPKDNPMILKLSRDKVAQARRRINRELKEHDIDWIENQIDGLKNK